MSSRTFLTCPRIIYPSFLMRPKATCRRLVREDQCLRLEEIITHAVELQHQFREGSTSTISSCSKKTRRISSNRYTCLKQEVMSILLLIMTNTIKRDNQSENISKSPRTLINLSRQTGKESRSTTVTQGLKMKIKSVSQNSWQWSIRN